MTWHSFRTDPPDARWPVIYSHPQWTRDELLVGLRADPKAESVRELMWRPSGIYREMAQCEGLCIVGE